MSNMSFVPDEYSNKKREVRVNTINLALFVVVMVGVIGAFFVTDKNRSKVTEDLRQVNLDFREAAKLLDDLEQLEGKKVVMIRKAQIITELIEKLPRSVLLAELTNNMPDTVSLNEIELKTQKKTKRSSRANTAIARARELQEKNKKKSRKKKGKKSSPSAPKLPPQEVMVIVLGVASTDTEVAKYMTSLGVSAMFNEVNLIFSEETSISDQKMRKFRFEMLINEGFDMNQFTPKLMAADKMKGLMDTNRESVAIPKNTQQDKQATDVDKEDSR